MRPLHPLGLATALTLGLALPLHAEPSQVLVVRHAERSTEPKDDPHLAEAGHARAQALAQLLAGAGVNTIVTTQYRRTQQTAAPLAQQHGLTPHVVAVQRGAVDAHVAEVVATVRGLSGVVLVVGHSNTVAGIVAGLSSSRPAPLCETQYAKLFVLAPGQPALPLHYGRPDAAPTADCP